MARGRTCPRCGGTMSPEQEQDQPAGRWVSYRCTNASCQLSEQVLETIAT